MIGSKAVERKEIGHTGAEKRVSTLPLQEGVEVVIVIKSEQNLFVENSLGIFDKNNVREFVTDVEEECQRRAAVMRDMTFAHVWSASRPGLASTGRPWAGRGDTGGGHTTSGR